jgi:hypothetical protein
MPAKKLSLHHPFRIQSSMSREDSTFSVYSQLPIPTKPPVYNGMIAPRDSWMMPPPCNEMIPPGAPRLLA